MNRRRLTWVKRVIRWSLAVVVVAYIVTGFGITEARTVESLTFGLLNKYWAFRIHMDLEIPFITLLALHMLLSPAIRTYLALRRRFIG